MITIITGSARKKSQSEKVAQFIYKRIMTYHPEMITIINLEELNLPLWNEENFKNSNVWLNTSEKLQPSSAFVIITPEWDGMASPALKNFFNYCRNYELFHKPALIVSVSAGEGGAYPIAELRMSSYKNSRICYLPEHILIRHAEDVLNDDSPENTRDELIRERIDYSLRLLKIYEDSLTLVRQHKFVFNSNFKNGM